MSSSEATTFRFLDLPPEIRLHIYEILLVQDSHFERSHPAYYRNYRPYRYDFVANLGLFRVCRQVYREASKCLYSGTSFTTRGYTDHDLTATVECYGSRALQRIQRFDYCVCIGSRYAAGRHHFLYYFDFDVLKKMTDLKVLRLSIIFQDIVKLGAGTSDYESLKRWIKGLVLAIPKTVELVHMPAPDLHRGFLELALDRLGNLIQGCMPSDDLLLQLAPFPLAAQSVSCVTERMSNELAAFKSSIAGEERS